MFVLFAFGALTYASHPEGVLEFQKRRWNEFAGPLVLQPRPADGAPALVAAGGNLGAGPLPPSPPRGRAREP